MAHITVPVVDALMNDGTEHTVLLNLKARLQWAKTSRARGWDSQDELTGQVFMVWYCMKQTGAFTGTFEEFEDAAAWMVAHEEAEETELNPTP